MSNSANILLYPSYFLSNFQTKHRPIKPTHKTINPCYPNCYQIFWIQWMNITPPTTLLHIYIYCSIKVLFSFLLFMVEIRILKVKVENKKESGLNLLTQKGRERDFVVKSNKNGIFLDSNKQQRHLLSKSFYVWTIKIYRFYTNNE